MTILALLLSSQVAAQDGDCFSKYTRYDVCQKAREIQRAMAPTLPMQMNANITLSTVAAVGPRIVLTAIWRSTKVDIESMLSSAGMSQVQLATRMEHATQNFVCGKGPLAAFVRLGGQMHYVYRSEDGFLLFDLVVTACD